MRATKKQAGKSFLYAEINLFILECFFYFTKYWGFFGNRRQPNACARQKKQMFFLVMRCLNPMRALI